MNQIITLCLVLLTVTGNSQKVFIKEGQIKFERKENMYVLLKDFDGLEDYKKTNPQFKTTYFDLIFDSKHSIYFTAGSKEGNGNNNGTGSSKKSFHSFNDCRFISQKEAYGEQFIVDDSCRAIKWKLVNERRVIAGFECKRANAIIMDSIYVVAFYTEDITPSVGPESFSGLPGAILGVVIPHNHVSWFASNINVKDVNKSLIVAPQRGQAVTSTELLNRMRSIIGSNDPYLESFLVLLLL